MVLRLSTTKIVSRSIDPVEVVSPEVTFVAIDTYIETSRKDEFIIGNLFDYNGNKISYTWDSKQNQVAALKGKNLNTEMIISASEFLKNLYKKPDPSLDVKVLSTHIVSAIQDFAGPNNVIPFKADAYRTKKALMANTKESEEIDNNFIYDYENDSTAPVFSGEFLGDDEEVDDFDEQLALKSQEFLKEHPELKSEMEIVRLLEGN
jgi:hypothetical protein